MSVPRPVNQHAAAAVREAGRRFRSQQRTLVREELRSLECAFREAVEGERCATERKTTEPPRS